ncbi:MAG TPA: ergothioneine biosynthesis protein EgtC, partial [Allocoleopsis sp.]
PEHSLIVQSYQPREMTAGLLNADGFGVGWYHQSKDTKPFIYKNILPIWNDVNLTNLNRYIESKCILAYVRSATAGLAVDLANCQPFPYQKLLFIHNGFIQDFHKTLYIPIRNLLHDSIYQNIGGSTDSEHIFALILNELINHPHLTIDQAIKNTLIILTELALSLKDKITISANIIIADNNKLFACRFAHNSPPPSLYWLKDHNVYNNAVIIASEPLFHGDWNIVPEHSIIIADQSHLETKLI